MSKLRNFILQHQSSVSRECCQGAECARTLALSHSMAEMMLVIQSTQHLETMQSGNISTFWMNTSSVYGTKFRCQTLLFMMSIHEN